MNTIILIGGAPAVGKSYLAQQLSLRFGIPWISTDQIRTTMQGVVREQEQIQHSLDTEGYIMVEEQPRKLTSQEIINIQNQENREVWDGVVSFIRKNDLWKSYIIEGVAILPELVDRDFKKDTHIKTLFLIDENLERIHSILRNRELWGDPNTFSDTMKTLGDDWILSYNTWFKTQLSLYPFPYIEATEAGVSIDRVLELIT